MWRKNVIQSSPMQINIDSLVIFLFRGIFAHMSCQCHRYNSIHHKLKCVFHALNGMLYILHEYFNHIQISMSVSTFPGLLLWQHISTISKDCRFYFWSRITLSFLNIYRVQSKVVRRPFSRQPLVADVYLKVQNWFKTFNDLYYGIFIFQKSILWKL